MNFTQLIKHISYAFTGIGIIPVIDKIYYRLLNRKLFGYRPTCIPKACPSIYFRS